VSPNPARLSSLKSRFENHIKNMYTIPMMFPLDLNGKIYVMQDENGNTIGTGTREVCETLLYIISKPLTPSVSDRPEVLVLQKPNLRAAITI
jgi:hypothetical protein